LAADLGGGRRFARRVPGGMASLRRNWSFGPWSRILSRSAPAKGVNYLQVQAMVLNIEADPERAKEIVRKIDWGALNKLIK
jgi:hypothetical protein